MRRRWIPLAAALGMTVALCPATSGWGQQTPQQPTFRSAVILVPVDVRVLDNRTGKPVTDLKRDDFTVLEDDSPQVIGQFFPITLRPDEQPAADTKTKMKVRETTFDTGPASRRVFLFMIGRGRLQEPSMGLDALATFVRTQLLPQDVVALFAYDRATDFTADHEQIARLIDRFKTAHLDINIRIENETSAGLAGVYGSQKLPASVQAKIDAVFLGAGTLASQRLDGKVPAASQAAADGRKTTDAMERQAAIAANAEMAKMAGVPSTMAKTIQDEIDNSMFEGLSLEEFVSQNAQMLQDLFNIYACIEYLRRFEGEKHLVYVTERGLPLQRREEDVTLARVASDARVALDTFQTGGLKPQAGGVLSYTWDQTTAFTVLRAIAQDTGGVSSIAEDGMVAMNRINAATLSGYQIGYYPTNGRWDGSYRKITVKVNRPDTTVLYRRGYYARRDLPSFNRRAFITEQRMSSAIAFRREITDIRLKLGASIVKEQGGYALKVQLRIDPTNLALPLVDGFRTGRVDIATLASDQNGKLLANAYHNADLKIPADVFAKVKADWIPYNVLIPVSPSARFVRVVVYDYKADLIGRADTEVW